jgi:hypothetical protein
MSRNDRKMASTIPPSSVAAKTGVDRQMQGKRGGADALPRVALL